MCSPSFFSPENYTDIAIRRENMGQDREATDSNRNQSPKTKDNEPQESEMLDLSPPLYGSESWCP